MLVQEKSESIMVDRNQYNMDGKSADGFSFNPKNDDTNPAVKDEGFEFRYYNEYVFVFHALQRKNLSVRTCTRT